MQFYKNYGVAKLCNRNLELTRDKTNKNLCVYEYLIKKFSRVNCWYLTKLDFVTDDHPPDKFSKKTLYSCTSLQQVFKPELIYVFHKLAFGDSSIMDHLKYMYFT